MVVLLPLVEIVRSLRQLQDSHGVIEMARIGGVVAVNDALDFQEPGAPGLGLLSILLERQHLVQAVCIRFVDPVPKPGVLRLECRDSVLVVLDLTGLRFSECLLHLKQGGHIHLETLQRLAELGDEVALRDVGAAADLAAASPARAAVVDVGALDAVLLLLEMSFGRDGAVAMAAEGEPDERDPFGMRPLDVAHDLLDTVKESLRDQRLVLSDDRLRLPSNQAVIERIREDPVNAAEPDGLPCQRMFQARFGRDPDQIAHAVASGRVELEQLSDERGFAGVDVNFSGCDVVDVAGRRDGGEAPLLHLLEHALGHFFGQVVHVVPGQNDLDVEPKLLRGPRVLADEEVLFEEVGFLVVLLDQVVDADQVRVVAGHPVGLLEDHGPDVRPRADEGDELREALPVAGLGGFRDGPGPGDFDALATSVLDAVLDLGIDRVAFLLLFFGGDPDVEDAFLAHAAPFFSLNFRSHWSRRVKNVTTLRLSSSLQSTRS